MHLNKHYSANAGVMLRRLCSLRSSGGFICESNCVYVDAYAWAAYCEPSAQTLTRDKSFARVAGFHRIYANKFCCCGPCRGRLHQNARPRRIHGRQHLSRGRALWLDTKNACLMTGIMALSCRRITVFNRRCTALIVLHQARPGKQ